MVAASFPEIDSLLWFRDRLRADEIARAAYEAEKRRIISEGITDGVDYSEAKTAFIRRLLDMR